MSFFTGSALDMLTSLRDRISSSLSTTTSPTGSGFAVDDEPSTAAATSPQATTSAGKPVSATTMRAMLALQSKGGNAKNMAGRPFARLDRDGNGRISKSEHDEVVTKLGNAAGKDPAFSALDTDHDGSVSPVELSTALRQQGKKLATRSTAATGSPRDLYRRLMQQQTNLLATTASGQTVAVRA